jgi:hypothetical protein
MMNGDKNWHALLSRSLSIIHLKIIIKKVLLRSASFNVFAPG